MFHNVKLNKLWNNIDWPRKLIKLSASKPSPDGTGSTSAPPPLDRCCTWCYRSTTVDDRLILNSGYEICSLLKNLRILWLKCRAAIKASYTRRNDDNKSQHARILISNISFKVFVVIIKKVHHKMGSICTPKDIFVSAFVVFMKETTLLLLLYILVTVCVGSSIMSISHTLN
jgi:hypothetical protein